MMVFLQKIEAQESEGKPHCSSVEIGHSTPHKTHTPDGHQEKAKEQEGDFLFHKFGTNLSVEVYEVGISPEVYGKIERGQTPITEERLRQISAALGFESWDMLRLSADELLLVLINRKTIPPKE